MKNILTVTIAGGLLCALMGTGQSQSETRYTIDRVLFEGNQAFQADRLRGVMISRPSSFLHSFPYHPEVLEIDAKNLQLFYHQQGYLEATVDTYTVVADTTRKRVHIAIRLSEGHRTFVEGVALFGNDYFPDERLYDRLEIRIEDPLLQKKLEKSSISLLTLYANHGFLDAQVDPSVRVNEETHRAIIDFYVDEGKQYRIGTIRIAGAEKTRENIIRRELRFRSGEVIDYSRLLASQRRLYLTGLFQSVFVRPASEAPGDSSTRDILIELKENMSGEFNVALGYGSVEKARGKIEAYNHNLRGTARQIGLVAKVSFVGRKGEVSFTEPWTLSTPWRTDLNAAMEYSEEPGYHLNRVGGQLMLGRQFLKRSTFTLTYRRERVDLSHIEVSQIPGKAKTNTNSLKMSLILDSRDNLFNSTRGSFLEWSNEIGRFASGGAENFLRLTLQLKHFRSIGSSTVVGSGLAVRWMDAGGGLNSIPLHERFYAGGPDVLRGFDYQEVGPLDEDRTPIGGRFKFVWNLLEIRRTVYKIVGMTVFTDIGSVWKNAEHARVKDLRVSPGIGLRMNTPVGLVRLDLGLNADRKAGEPATKIYFSMGQAF